MKYMDVTGTSILAEFPTEINENPYKESLKTICPISWRMPIFVVYICLGDKMEEHKWAAGIESYANWPGFTISTPHPPKKKFQNFSWNLVIKNWNHSTFSF